MPRYCTFIFVAMMITLISCEEITEEDLGSFENQINFLMESEHTSKLNLYAETYDISEKNIFIYFVNGGCDLCSLNLSEIENVKKLLFNKYGVTPIVVLYGKVKGYTFKLIKDKEIYNYPIYSINFDQYDYLMSLGTYKEALLLNNKRDVIYTGSPLIVEEDMSRLLNVLQEF